MLILFLKDLVLVNYNNPAMKNLYLPWNFFNSTKASLDYYNILHNKK